MNALIGEYALSGALAVSAITLIAALGAAIHGTPNSHRAARWGLGVFALMFAIASAALLSALYHSDFSISYVASYTERALPMGYKISAFWAGQEGSLLFWGVTLAVMTAAFVFVRRRDESREQAVTLLVLSIICGFFAAMLLLAANPFTVTKLVPEDGHGLNPMLQNIGMIAHPPTLFIGYAGFTIPFALMIAALICGNMEKWIGLARRWVLLSWVFLTVGIVLGAQWAYVELGWGGYWAWDPVENASLLPWLTGTALLHSIVVQQHRAMFRGWNVALAAATFLLCIFGTYITRSGVIQSVHAFQPSLIGTFFLRFLIISILTCVILVIFRWRKLKADTEMQSLISKEVAVLIGNAMLVAMMLLTLLGTVFPLINGLAQGLGITDNSITITQGFYNKAVLPFAILMLMMMGVAPLLMYGSMKIGDLFRRMRIPLAIASLTTIFVALTVGTSLWTILCTLAITLTICGMAADYITVVFLRRKNTQGSLAGSFLAVLDANHRRYGGHLAHLGMAMIVAGVLGSSLYAEKQELQLMTGDSATVGAYTVRLDAVQTVKAANFTGYEAAVTVTDRNKKDHQLSPQIRRYNKSEQNNAEVDFLTGLREDVYVTLQGFEAGEAAAIKVVVNPLVLWIWIGGIAMTIGGFWAMLPTLVRSRAQAEAIQEAKVAT